MPRNREAEEAWLDAVAEDPIEDLSEADVKAVLGSDIETTRDDKRYMAWMEFYTYPRCVGNHCYEVTCKGCGEVISRAPMYGWNKKGKKVIVKSGRERVMDAVETHILRGHRDPDDHKPFTAWDMECPF